MDLLSSFYKKYPINKLTIQNKKWEYITAGKGKETFVIFPGGAQAAQDMFYYIREFEDMYTVIAITLYDADSIEEYCYAAEAIIEKESIGNIIFYGYSIGGMLVQSLMRRTKLRQRIKKIIVSHACTPGANIYKYGLVMPFQVIYFFVLLLPDNITKFVTRMFALRAQGFVKNKNFKNNFDEKTKQLQTALVKEFYEKYLNKRLWKTWYKIHTEYCYKERFLPKYLKDWNGKILIIQTDNDPWMRDEAGFRKLYPKALFLTFHGTAHLTFYYQFPEMIKAIKEFL